MSGKMFRSISILAGSLYAMACGEASLTESVEADVELQAAIAEAGVAATVSGDVVRAEALNRGAEALRWGIRPSRIEVKIHNETYSYLAIVVGMVRRNAAGERVLVRSLVAWTGRPPTALLHVTSKSDMALFGHSDNGGGNDGDSGPEGARGQWKDLVNHEVWVATSGSAETELASTGGACPVQPTLATLRCVLARFDVRINGAFQLVGSGGPDGAPMQIHTNADGVAGVIIKPAE